MMMMMKQKKKNRLGFATVQGRQPMKAQARKEGWGLTVVSAE